MQCSSEIDYISYKRSTLHLQYKGIKEKLILKYVPPILEAESCENLGMIIRINKIKCKMSQIDRKSEMRPTCRVAY